jgi:hypothetical protein
MILRACLGLRIAAFRPAEGRPVSTFTYLYWAAPRLGWQSTGLAIQRIVRQKERISAPHKKAVC